MSHFGRLRDDVRCLYMVFSVFLVNKVRVGISKLYSLFSHTAIEQAVLHTRIFFNFWAIIWVNLKKKFKFLTFWKFKKNCLRALIKIQIEYFEYGKGMPKLLKFECFKCLKMDKISYCVLLNSVGNEYFVVLYRVWLTFLQ